jgi:hypothetical protein
MKSPSDSPASQEWKVVGDGVVVLIYERAS